MNFWTFKEDDSRGYYHPVSNKAARRHGGQLVRGLISPIVFIPKLAIGILWAVISLLLPSRPKGQEKVSMTAT
jgi:hypothetical protein